MSDPAKKKAQIKRAHLPILIPECGRSKSLKPEPAEGREAWHPGSSVRFSFPLPSVSKGPIYGREARKKKGVQGY